MIRCYYDIKYPYLSYPFRDVDGTSWYMFSIPVSILADVYKSYYGKMPRSFFDCGAAIGELIRQAEKLNICAAGIDIKKYPVEKFAFMQKYVPYFTSGKIQIKSILDCDPIQADLAYCNGTLTYLTEETLPRALEKFRGVRMLTAIHNTTEDVTAARALGEKLVRNEPRLIKPNQWWIDTFRKNGFNAVLNEKYNLFCAIPKHGRIK